MNGQYILMNQYNSDISRQYKIENLLQTQNDFFKCFLLFIFNTKEHWKSNCPYGDHFIMVDQPSKPTFWLKIFWSEKEKMRQKI